jgi:superfamily II DNA/RNA helicase
LNCLILHWDVEDKESVITKFHSQNSTVLVCTSVLSANFDYSFVLAVIHFQSDWQRDSSVHDVDYESFDSILCSNRSQKSQEISI